MSDELRVSGVLVSDAERVLRTSPWPAINRANGIQWLLIMLAPFPALAFIIFATNPPSTVVVLSGVLLILSLLGVIWAASRVWSVYTKLVLWSPTRGETDDWCFTPTDVLIESASLKISCAWNALVDVTEISDVFYFILSPAQVWALPKRALNEEQLERLLGLIAAAKARGDIKGIAR